MGSLKSLVLLGVFCLLSWHQTGVNLVSGGEIDCPSDEYDATSWLAKCEPTCRRPILKSSPWFTCEKIEDHVPKCWCAEPKVRHTSTGRCVEFSECPRRFKSRRGSRSRNRDSSSSAPPPSVKCSPDEYVNTQNLAKCEPTCQEPRAIEVQERLGICPKTLDTTPKCFCAHPKVRDTRTGRCVYRRVCPETPSQVVSRPPLPPGFKCGPDEHVDQVSHPTCEETCGHTPGYVPCFLIIDSSPKCFCNEPKVRDKQLGRCVLRSECSYEPIDLYSKCAADE